MRLREEKGAESKGQLGRCFHSRRTQTPQAGVTRQETVSCVPQVIRTAFYSRPAAVLGQAGLKRRGRRQKELGWLPLGTEKVFSRYTGPRTLLQNTLYLEAARSTSKFSRSGRRAPAAWLPSPGPGLPVQRGEICPWLRSSGSLRDQRTGSRTASARFYSSLGI